MNHQNNPSEKLRVSSEIDPKINQNHLSFSAKIDKKTFLHRTLHEISTISWIQTILVLNKV